MDDAIILCRGMEPLKRYIMPLIRSLSLQTILLRSCSILLGISLVLNHKNHNHIRIKNLHQFLNLDVFFSLLSEWFFSKNLYSMWLP